MPHPSLRCCAPCIIQLGLPMLRDVLPSLKVSGRACRKLAMSACIPLSMACGPSPDAERSALVRDSAGVRIVEYSAEEVGRPSDSLDIIEELRVGASLEGGLTEFARLDQVIADVDQRIYALDLGQRMLVRFGSDGRFDRVVARGGEGPGELGSGRLHLLSGPGDSVLVVDRANARLHLYDSSGMLARDIPILVGNSSESTWDISGDGTLLKQSKTVITDSASAARVQNVITTITPDGAEGRELLSLTIGDVLDMRGGVSGVETVIFAPEDYWRAVGDNRIAVANSNAYRFRVFTTDGRLRTTIAVQAQQRAIEAQDREDYLTVMRSALEDQLGRSRQPNTRQLIDGIVASTTFASHYPAFASFMEGPYQTIMVQRVQTMAEIRAAGMPITLEAIQAGSRVWDVFRLDGSYVGPIQLPPNFRPTDAGPGTLLGVSEDADGSPVLLRLRVSFSGRQ